MKKIKITFENFTRLDQSALALVYKWRTSEEIRKAMETQEKFSLESHLSFCNSLKKREDKLYFFIKYNGVPCGVYDYVDINKEEKSAEVGMYFISDYKKYAPVICFFQLFVCKKYGIKKLTFYVHKDNMKAVLFNAVKMKNPIIGEDEKNYYFESICYDPEEQDTNGYLQKYDYVLLDN